MRKMSSAETKQQDIAVQAINQLLYSNWAILQSLIREEKRICSMKRLSLCHFSFQYHTHIVRAGNRLFSFVYDIGWHIMDDKWVLLIPSSELKD